MPIADFLELTSVVLVCGNIQRLNLLRSCIVLSIINYIEFFLEIVTDACNRCFPFMCHIMPMRHSSVVFFSTSTINFLLLQNCKETRNRYDVASIHLFTKGDKHISLHGVTVTIIALLSSHHPFGLLLFSSQKLHLAYCFWTFSFLVNL